MMKPVSDVVTDFDLIAAALANAPPQRRLTSAETAVLNAIPPHARSALDVGCGDGLLARAMASRGMAVTAIDVAPQMIALARARTAPDASIDYRVADVMDSARITPSFDAVVSINVAHHLPLPLLLPRLAVLTAPDGAVVIQDIVTRRGLRYLPINLTAAVVARLGRLVAHDRASRHVRGLYELHGRGETYLEPHTMEERLGRYLPGIRVRHHLSWRYTAVWVRPST